MLTYGQIWVLVVGLCRPECCCWCICAKLSAGGGCVHLPNPISLTRHANDPMHMRTSHNCTPSCMACRDRLLQLKSDHASTL